MIRPEKVQISVDDLPFYVVATLGWGLFFAIVIKYLAHPIHDPDIWWHLANGRAMVENRTLLKTDIFSHTLQGAPWINFEWLSQIGAYLLVKAFGLNGLYDAKILLGLTSLLFLGLSARMAGARGPFLFLLTWLGYHILKVRLCTRVELVSFNFMPLYLIILLKAQTLPPPHQKKASWILAALMVLWCNAHGGYIYGLMLLAAFLIGARWSRMKESYIRFLDRSFTLILIASLINPYGVKLIHLFAEVASDFHGGPNPIAEWAEADIKSLPFFWISFLTCGIMMVRSVLKEETGTRFWIPAVLLFSVVCSFYQRNTALYAFVSIPFLADVLRRVTWPSHWFGRPWRAVVATAALVFVLLFKELPLLRAHLPPEVVDWRVFPAGACRFLKEQNINGRLFNSYGYGGFISWTLGPERKIFMDGRYPFYPLLKEKTDLLDERRLVREKDWQRFFDKYRVDHALTRYFMIWLPPPYPQEPFPISMMDLMFPRSKWALVYWDANAAVFLKRIPRHEKIIQQNEFKTIWPYNLKKMRAFLASGQLQKKDVLNELERYRTHIGETAPYRAIKKMVDEGGAKAP